MTINKTWFEEHKSYIEQLYMDQYVAIYNCQVFASDKNLQRLIDLFADECGEAGANAGLAHDVQHNLVRTHYLVGGVCVTRRFEIDFRLWAH